MQSNIEDAIKGTLLWQNPNPNNAMGDQTINLNSSEYDFYEVFYKNNKDVNRLKSQKSIKGSGVSIFGLEGSSQGNTYIRDLDYVNDTTMFVGICANPGVSYVNDYCVPIYIIGYKTGLFD